YIGMISRELKATNEKIGYIHSEKQIYAIQDIAINILVVLTSAGLDSSQSLDWQQQPENLEYQQELFSELEVFSLVQEEIISKLQNYQNVLNTFVSTYPGHQFADIFLQTLEVFEKAPDRENHDGQALVLT
ncbi:MAG: hypothetical protein GY770_31435, partial [Aestuariibacter sp.]|nr:hypothetical protein [Aestuariibacter sp.]